KSVPHGAADAEKQFDCSAGRRFCGTESDSLRRTVPEEAQRHGRRVLHIERRAVLVPGRRELETFLCKRIDVASRFQQHVYSLRPEQLGISTTLTHSRVADEGPCPKIRRRTDPYLLRRG